jgi:mono/diheme cytochrome c family protein
MLNEPSSKLVEYLEHPNGWWRDQAQQLLVLRKDKSVVSKLNKMALSSKNVLARIHAIWTLEGLDALTSKNALKLLQDPNPRIRIQALRASETLYKAGDKTLEPAYKSLLTDVNTDVLMQAMMTAKFLKLPDYTEGVKNAMVLNKSAGVKLIGEQMLAPPKPSRNMGSFGTPELSAEQKIIVERGATIYSELCAQCHGTKGLGTPVGEGKLMAPPLAGAFRMQMHPEYAIKTVLHGLDGAIEGKTYTGNMMASM